MFVPQTSLSSVARAVAFTGQVERSTYVLYQSWCSWQVMQNFQDLANFGAHPRRWTELPIARVNRHLQYALPQLGQPGGAPIFGSKFMVIAH